MDEAARERIATEELGFGDYLHIAFTYFRKEMLVILLITALVNFPVNLLGECLTAEPKNVLYYAVLALVYFFTTVMVFFFTPLLVLWSASVIRQKVETGSASWMEAWNEAAERFTSSLWILILQTFLVGGLFLLFVVPGIMALIYMTFTLPIIAITGLRGSEAMDYSKRLVEGRWWQTAGNIFLYNLLAVCLMIMVGTVTVILPMLFWPESNVVFAAANTIAQIVRPVNLLIGFVAPIVSVPVTIWFINWHWLAAKLATGSSPAPDSSTFLPVEP